jgi:hypothetical protein
VPEILLLWALSFLPPQHIKVNGEPWKIAVVKESNGSIFYSGYTFCDRKLIELRAGGPEELRDTAIHELMHALTCSNGEAHNELWNNVSDKKHESHAGIYRMAPKLVRLFRDNPELVAFLQKGAQR